MKDLSPAEMTQVMEAIVTGRMSDEEIERFLLGLREKGETVAEIAAAVKVMRKHSLQLSKNFPSLLDTCGTGGDGCQTFNVSTVAAILACAAGAKVAKHGNRSVSSTCGSADLLEMLGVKIDLPTAAIERSIEGVGFGFFFAPTFHPATRFAMPARKKIKGKTIFNILGPLSNPAGACYQLLGVYEESLVEIVAKVLLELDAVKALVVHGKDGLDEISISAETVVAELHQGKVKTYEIKPEHFGLTASDPAALQCASKEEAKQIALKVLQGKKGAASDIVCLNAGAALYAAGLVSSIQEGLERCQTTLEQGAALKKLEKIVAINQC